MALSIIISTYKNVEFLPELFNSIENSNYDKEYEVLVGIDSCDETLEYIYNNTFSNNHSFYYFFNNGGPYLIKNTLCDISKFDKVLFFDSDDIMLPDLLKTIDESLDIYDVIKPKYLDFKDEEGERKYVGKEKTFGEGVFGIKKDLFLYMNGFEGWRVAADSDFMGRLYKTNKKVLHTQRVLLHRRIHENSLTVHPETNLSSTLRGSFFLKSKKKGVNDVINKELKKSKYQKVDFENRDSLKTLSQIESEKEITEFEEKKIKHDSISKIFSKNYVNTSKSKPTKTIDYGRLNEQSKNSTISTFTNAIKKAKLENLGRKYR